MLFGHWTVCNVYVMTVAGISKKVTALFNKYSDIQKNQCKKKSLKYWEKYDRFKDNQNRLFDIHGENNYVRAQDKFWEVEITAADKAFYNDPKDARKQFCTKNVDPNWRARQERRKKRRQRSRVESYNADEVKGVNFGEEPNCSNHEDNVQVDAHYNIEEDQQNSSPPSKKEYEYVPTTRDEADDGFPAKYPYPRDGLRGMKLELYATMHTLKAK